MGDSADLERSAVENPAIVRETILIQPETGSGHVAMQPFFFGLSFRFVGCDLCLGIVCTSYTVPVIEQDTAGVCAGASQRYG